MTHVDHRDPRTTVAVRDAGSQPPQVAARLVVVILFCSSSTTRSCPNLVRPVSAPVIAWLPVATINECLMWAIMALGLNIVVGYAGLLDLGYVAFWALGGYTAGWLMSFRSTGPGTSTCSRRCRTGCRASTSTSGWSAHRRPASARILGVIIGAPTLRLSSDYLALVTLGFGEIITQFFRNGDDIVGLQHLQRRPRASPRSTPIGSGPLGAAGIAPPTPDELRGRQRVEVPRLRLPGRPSASSSRSGSARAGSAGPGWPSARTSWRPA